jgi:hypothetical protein
MNDNRSLFIEEMIIGAIKRLLDKRVNEILQNWEFVVPIIEFGTVGNYAVSPAVSLTSCERTEKERIIRQDAYSVSISFTLKEHKDGELYCYGYASAFGKALGEDITLGGIADKAVITGKKYVQPKNQTYVEGWSLTLTLRVTVEGFANAG